MPTFRPPRATPHQWTRGSSRPSAAETVCAPSVKTRISAAGSWAVSARAVLIACVNRFVTSRASTALRADVIRSRSREKATTTRGWIPASITMTSVPAGRRLRNASASRWAATKRDGATSVAFMEADVSRMITVRCALWPLSVTAGRASASVRASSARIWRSRSGSRWRRWKKAEASRSRSAGSQRRRLDTLFSRRRTLRKYRSRSGTDRVKSRNASGERKLTGAGAP